MNFQETSYKMLLVSSSEKFNTSFQSCLPKSRLSKVRVEGDMTNAQRILIDESFDFVIINTFLSSEDSVRLAIDIGSNRPSVVLLVVPADIYPDVFHRVAKYGVMVIAKPIARVSVEQAIDYMTSYRERLRRLEKKTTSLESRMQEIRTVNRAKWLLIEEMKMSEADAHRYIEKQAMDRSETKLTIAEEIIRMYA